MITRNDMEFHRSDDMDHSWAETTYFDVHLPERGIHAWVYLVFRTGVGVVVSDVGVVDRRCDSLLDATYLDLQNHVPIPERMSRFTLPTGLSLDATSGPRDYRVDYVGDQDTELHLDVRGLMEPYDIHDPTMDPLAAADAGAAVENSGFGAAYKAHFDLTCRVTGTLRVRGTDYDVDCVTSMDHSWGPRAERGMRSFCWMNANFDGPAGSEYALQASLSFDPLADPARPHVLKHGYAMVDGKVRGAVSGSLEVVRDRFFMDRAELTLVDVDGREHHATGRPLTRHTWLPYSLCMTPLQMLRWESAGRTGHGTVMESWPLDTCAGRGL